MFEVIHVVGIGSPFRTVCTVAMAESAFAGSFSERKALASTSILTLA